MNVIIHANLWLQNQLESAQWLAEGFKRHGIDAEITGNKHKAADVHVIQGPWYAYREWLGKPNVLFLNRCFYGDSRFDLSIGWLNPDGSRGFRNHGAAEAKGTLPELQPLKERGRCAVVFADYGRDPTADIEEARQTYDSLFFRPHPQQPIDTKAITLKGPLSDVWALADVAIGHGSTVLVEARINGLTVVSSDPLHVVHGSDDRETWLRELSWAQWSAHAHNPEIQRGDFWEHLR